MPPIRVRCLPLPAFLLGLALVTASPLAALSPAQPPLPAAPSSLAPRPALSGLVLDPAGAVIPGATIQLSGIGATPATATYSATADSAGRYTIAALPPGTYWLMVDSPGFAPQTVASVTKM